MGEYRKHRGSFLISKSINPQIISHFSTSSTLYIIHYTFSINLRLPIQIHIEPLFFAIAMAEIDHCAVIK